MDCALRRSRRCACAQAAAAKLHLPAANIPGDKMRAQVNSALSSRFAHTGGIRERDRLPAGMAELGRFRGREGERRGRGARSGRGPEASGHARLLHALATGAGRRAEYRNSDSKYLHSYSPLGWMVCAGSSGAVHRGRQQREPITPRPTPMTRTSRWLFTVSRFSPALTALTPNPSTWPQLWLRCSASTLLSHAIGRVLTEALARARRASNSSMDHEREDRSCPAMEGRGFQQGAIRDFSGEDINCPALAAAVPTLTCRRRRARDDFPGHVSSPGSFR